MTTTFDFKQHFWAKMLRKCLKAVGKFFIFSSIFEGGCRLTFDFKQHFGAKMLNFLLLTLVSLNEVSIEKLQHDAENACGNRMCKLDFYYR